MPDPKLPEDERPGPADVPDAPEQRGGIVRSLLQWSPIIIVIAGGLAAYAFGLGDYISISTLVDIRDALTDFVTDRPAASVAAYCGTYILAVVFSVPGGSVLTIVGGLMFGGALGGILTTLAATAGSLAVFLVAQSTLGGWMRVRTQTMGPQLTSLAEGFRNNAFYVIVVLRLIPVMPYWASNAVPALFNVSIRTFVLATMVGLLPWTVSFAFFGAALEGIIAAQELDNPGCAAAGTCEINVSSFTSGPVLTGVAIALLSLVPVIAHWWARRRRLRREAEAAASREN